MELMKLFCCYLHFEIVKQTIIFFNFQLNCVAFYFQKKEQTKEIDEKNKNKKKPKPKQKQLKSTKFHNLNISYYKSNHVSTLLNLKNLKQVEIFFCDCSFFYFSRSFKLMISGNCNRKNSQLYLPNCLVDVC